MGITKLALKTLVKNTSNNIPPPTPMAEVIAEVVAHRANSAPSVHVSMIKYPFNQAGAIMPQLEFILSDHYK
jgi:hypothetical protein